MSLVKETQPKVDRKSVQPKQRQHLDIPALPAAFGFEAVANGIVNRSDPLSILATAAMDLTLPSFWDTKDSPVPDRPDIKEIQKKDLFGLILGVGMIGIGIATINPGLVAAGAGELIIKNTVVQNAMSREFGPKTTGAPAGAKPQEAKK